MLRVVVKMWCVEPLALDLAVCAHHSDEPEPPNLASEPGDSVLSSAAPALRNQAQGGQLLLGADSTRQQELVVAATVRPIFLVQTSLQLLGEKHFLPVVVGEGWAEVRQTH